MSHTLAEVFQYASQYIRLAPLTFASGPIGGRTSDPALSIGDWVRQTLLSPPFAWRWNRATTTITTVIGTQDYVASTASAVTMTCPNPTTVQITSNVLTLTSAGFGGTTTFGAVVNFAGFTHASLLFLNGTSATVISSSATVLVVAYNHANVGPVSEIGGVATARVFAAPNFGWLEKASITASGVAKELEVAMVLAEDSQQNLPVKIAPQLDNGAGTVTFRLLPVPDKVYTLQLTWQQAAPTFTATSDTWSPLPDYMYHIYSSGVLAKAYEYLGDARWPFTMNMFLKQLVSFHGGLTESQVNVFLSERLIFQSGNQGAALNTQQRVSSRGLQ